MSQRILIIGAGGHGKVVADILRARGNEPAGFVDAEESLWGSTIMKLPVLGGMQKLERIARDAGAKRAVVAIGDNWVRMEVAREVQRAGLDLASAIHPSATVSPAARLGKGVVICMGAAVCAEANLGDLAIVNTNATVDHECEIGDAAHIGPNASLAGRVRVGQGTFVGIGATVIQCLQIGEWSTIGANATVLSDIPAITTAVGTPAKVIVPKPERYPRVASA